MNINNVINCEQAERDADLCCGSNESSLSILRDVQRLYSNKMEIIERSGGNNMLQMKVDLFKSWVKDLVDQNTLLARAVEELEQEATNKLRYERKKNSEVVSELRVELAALRRRMLRKDSDLRGLIEVLRRLRDFDCCGLDGINFFEVTESDIFGSLEWRQRKLEQGDSLMARRLKVSDKVKTKIFL